jgi:hypothetical protein
MLRRVNDGLVSTFLLVASVPGGALSSIDILVYWRPFRRQSLVLSASLLASLSLQQSLTMMYCGEKSCSRGDIFKPIAVMKMYKVSSLVLALIGISNQQQGLRQELLTLMTIVPTHYWNSYGCAGFWCHWRGACGDQRYGRVGPWMHPPRFK